MSVAAFSQTLTGRAPSQVAAGEQFRLSYTVNTDDVKNFRAGNIPEEFDVLMGPSTSTQSSYQLVNGHMSSSSSVTYTYILMAKKNDKDKKDQQKDKQDQQKQDQDKKDQQQKQQQLQQQKQQMSRENAEQMLNAAMQEEKQTQERMKKAMQQSQKRRLEKNW